jgi:hypothetical protein
MNELFASYPLAAWSLVSVLLALVVVAALWEKVKWWWLNTWMSFPVIGRIARLSGDANADVSYPGWYSGERTLCQEYKDFVHVQDEHDFNEKISYLTKAGDNGRKDTPKWIWLLTVSMVFVEAMGFSYVLAGYTIPGASENLQQTGAYGIAFLISVILVAFTHFAGHELYKSGRIRNARREWVEDKRSHKLYTGTIPLAKPQSSDDGMPGYTQLCNRVGSHPGYMISFATLAIVLLIACGATYVRGQVLEKELEARVTRTSADMAGAQPAGDSLDMSGKNVPLPAADAASNNAADTKAASDEADIDRHGGWATFIILAFVFVFLQLLGVIFGFRWGFAGQNSPEAFRDIGYGRYSSYTAVREHYRRVADTAQAKLSILQQRIMARNSTHGTSGQHLSKSFRDYIQETRVIDEHERQNERRHAAAVANAVTAPRTADVARPMMEEAKPAVEESRPAKPTVEASNPAAEAAAGHPSVSAVLAQLEALGDDKAAKVALMATMPADMGIAVVAALKAKKAEKDRKAINDELEGLL